LEFNVPFQHKYGYIRDEELLGLFIRVCIALGTTKRRMKEEIMWNLDAHISVKVFVGWEDN